MILNELLGLPRSGVIILLKGKGFLITHSTSMGATLEGLYNEFRGQAGITMEVVSAGADIETLKLHCEYYKARYEGMGFKSLQTQFRKSIQYRVRVLPNKDFKTMDVELVTARGDSSRVTGKFKTVREAQDFIETYYGTGNEFNLPVYAVNSDTKELVLELQTKMLKLI